MTEFVSNAAAVIFAVVLLISLIALVSRTGDVLLTVGLMLAGVGGLVLALAGRVG